MFAERTAMKRAGDRDQVAFTPQNQRGTLRRGEADRPQCVINHAIPGPAKESRAERPQGDAASALGDERYRCNANLDTGSQNDLGTMFAIVSQGRRLGESADAPSVPLMDQRCMPRSDAPVDQPQATLGCAPDKMLTHGRLWRQWVETICAPFAQVQHLVVCSR
jgi:hypothetical protein